MANTLLDIRNPDSSSILNKEQIDISLSLFDISASGNFEKIQTNYAATTQRVTIPETNFINSSSYYTPIYKEKLNYSVWLNRVNKNFEELN
jgi:hypothetical protein